MHRMQESVQVLFTCFYQSFFLLFASTKVQILTQRGMQGGPGGALLKLSGMGLGEEDYAALHVILAGE